MSREFEQVVRVKGKMFPPPVAKQPAVVGNMTPNWDVLPDEAVEAVAENLKGMYRTYPVEMAQKVILAALPQLLLESWDLGYSSATDEVPNKPISTKATEPAAIAIYSFCGEGWEFLSPIERAGFRADAELALKVAVQHLPVLKTTFDMAADAATGIHKNCKPAVTNPYQAK